MIDDEFNRSRVGILRDILVLNQTILGSSTSFQFDGKIDESEYDRFELRDGRLLESSRGEDVVQCLERSLRLTDVDQLFGALGKVDGRMSVVFLETINRL